MKARIVAYLLVVLAAVAVVAPLSGCNTLRGVGKDIETGGVAIQDAVNR